MPCFNTGREEVTRIMKLRAAELTIAKARVTLAQAASPPESLAEIAAEQTKAFLESILGSLEEIFDVDSLIKENKEALDLPKDIVEARYESVRQFVMTELGVSGLEHAPGATRKTALADIKEAERVLEELAAILLTIRALSTNPLFNPPTNSTLEGIRDAQENAQDRLNTSLIRIEEGQPTKSGRSLLVGFTTGAPSSTFIPSDAEEQHLPATTSRTDTSRDVVQASDQQPITDTLDELGDTIKNNGGNILICLALKSLTSTTSRTEHLDVLFDRLLATLNELLTLDPLAIAGDVVSAQLRANARLITGALSRVEGATSALSRFLELSILKIQTELQQTVKSISDPTVGLQIAESLAAICNVKLDDFCKGVDLSRLVANLGLSLGFGIKGFSADVIGKIANIRIGIETEALGFESTIKKEIANIKAQLNKLRVAFCRFLHGQGQNLAKEINIALASILAITTILVIIRLILEAQAIAENVKLQLAIGKLRLMGMDQAADALDCGDITAFSSMDLSDASSDARISKQLRAMANEQTDGRIRDEILVFAAEFESKAATSRLVAKMRISSEEALEFRINQQKAQADLNQRRFSALTERIDSGEALREPRAIED